MSFLSFSRFVKYSLRATLPKYNGDNITFLFQIYETILYEGIKNLLQMNETGKYLRSINLII